MAETIPLRVCVISLTYGQHGDISSRDVRGLINLCSETYNILEKGSVYGESQDDWCPFEDHLTIMEYIRNSGFQEVSLSNLLNSQEDPSIVDTLINDVDLYIFDPMFLTLRGQSELINRIEGSISGTKKPFCLIIPNRLPSKLSQILLGIAEKKLPILKRNYELGGFGEWLVDQPMRLNAYLNRLLREKENLPYQENLKFIKTLLGGYGIPPIHLDQSPKFMGNP